MQKYWRDRAFDHHRFIKAQGFAISRDMPAEIYPAFLTYYTRQQLLESYYGDALMDLLRSAQPYVVLDAQLGTKRIADLLNIQWEQAQQLADMFMTAFEELAPTRVFRNDEDFVTQVVLPRIIQTLEASHDFAAAFSALDAPRVRVSTDYWADTQDFYNDLPVVGPGGRALASPQKPPRALREEKGDAWTFEGIFNVVPADAAGNVISANVNGWVRVRIHFDKLDRALISPGDYLADTHGEVVRGAPFGPFDVIDEPKADIPISF